MLSLSATVFTDEYYIAGPAILEVTQDIAVY